MTTSLLLSPAGVQAPVTTSFSNSCTPPHPRELFDDFEDSEIVCFTGDDPRFQPCPERPTGPRGWILIGDVEALESKLRLFIARDDCDWSYVTDDPKLRTSVFESLCKDIYPLDFTSVYGIFSQPSDEEESVALLRADPLRVLVPAEQEKTFTARDGTRGVYLYYDSHPNERCRKEEAEQYLAYGFEKVIWLGYPAGETPTVGTTESASGIKYTGESSERKDLMVDANKTLSALRLEVIGELPDNKIRVRVGDKWDILDTSKLTYNRLLQTCGPEMKAVVVKSNEKKGDDTCTLADVKEAIATVASQKPIQSMPEILADQICESENLAIDSSGRLHTHKGGYYQSLELFTKTHTHFVHVSVAELCKQQHFAFSNRLAAQVEDCCRGRVPKLWDRPPLDVINLRNGLLRVSDCTLLPHSPQHLSTVQLPVEYDPHATCPAIEDFVSDVFPEDAASLAYELPAWLMTPDRDIQKMVLLHGPGGGGKSIYLSLLTAFLGEQHVSGVSIHELEGDRFAASHLVGKLANICPDLPIAKLPDTSILKRISGGDKIWVQRKFGHGFDTELFARMVFSGNTIPRSDDSTDAFFDRWLILPFERAFRGTEREVPRRELLGRLTTPREISGFLNRALATLPQIRRVGLSQPQSIKRAAIEFRSVSDPLGTWLDQWTIDDPLSYISRRELRTTFNAHLERTGKPPLTDSAFGKKFKTLRPDVSEEKRTVMGGRREWFYIGIGLREVELAEEMDAVTEF